MSYRMEVDRFPLAEIEFIDQIQRTIVSWLAESGMTQQEVAEALGVDRSLVCRRLNGSANLTSRSIADFAEVFNKIPRLVGEDMPNCDNRPDIPETVRSVFFNGRHEDEPAQTNAGTLVDSMLQGSLP